MGHSSFDDFIKKLQQDGALQKELRDQLGDPAEGIATADLARFAAAKGYAFDVQEIGSELGEDQLEQVAGGAVNYFLKIDSGQLSSLTDRTTSLTIKLGDGNVWFKF